MKSTSWVIVKDGKAVFETFNKKVLDLKCKEGVKVVPIYDYLINLNKEIARDLPPKSN